MTLWLTILFAGLVTFATRLSFILFLDRLHLPPWFQRGLRLVPPAVLAALIAPEVFIHNDVLDLSFGNTRLLAGALAAVVAYRTRNVFLTIAVGMAAFLLLGLWT